MAWRKRAIASSGRSAAEQGEAEAVLQLGRAGLERDGLLEVRDRLARLPLLQERPPEVGAAPEVLRVEGNGPLEAHDRLAQPPGLGERRPEVAQRLGVLGVELEGPLVARDRLADPSGRHERRPEAALGLVKLRVQRDRLLEVRDGLGRPARRGQGGPQAVLRPVVVGVEGEGLLPRRDRRRVAPLLRERRGPVEEPVELGGRRVDLQQPVGRDVHELRDVHGAVGRRRVLDQDRRAVVAFFVQVGQEHLRVGRAALRGEHQPAPVGREAVPGVHQRRVAAHRRASPPSAGTM